MEEDKVEVKETTMEPKGDVEENVKKQVTMDLPTANVKEKGAGHNKNDHDQIKKDDKEYNEDENEGQLDAGAEHKDYEGKPKDHDHHEREQKDHHETQNHKDQEDYDEEHKALPQADGDDIESKITALFQEIKGAKKNVQPRLVRPKLTLANTYQLGPIVPFSTGKVEKIIKVTLNEVLDGMTYNSKRAANLTGRLAEIIRDKVLEQQFDRYKIIVLVSIGPKGGQGVDIGTQCLWDSTRDKVAYGEFINQHIFASACVYGIYYD